MNAGILRSGVYMNGPFGNVFTEFWDEKFRRKLRAPRANPLAMSKPQINEGIGDNRPPSGSVGRTAALYSAGEICPNRFVGDSSDGLRHPEFATDSAENSP